MAHSSVENYMHLIFSTKNREPLIFPETEERLHSYIVGICRNRRVPVLKINGIEDHIHMLVNLHPSVALANLVKECKSYSTGWMKKNGCPKFSWQEGYGGFSYTKSMVVPVIKYIQNQKQHHQNQTFKEEIDFIKKTWNIEWDV